MKSKSFVFILLMFLTGATLFAQDAPESKKTKDSDEKSVSQAFSIAFGNSGSSYLGIHMGEVTNENFSKYGLSSVRGVVATRVAEDSPAAKAGINEGDVIISVDGESVTSVRKLSRLISEIAPDHNAKIKVLRGGSERDFDVKMGKREAGAVFAPGGFENGTGIGVYRMPRIEAPEMPKMPRMPRIATGPGEALGFYRISSRSIGTRLTPLTDQLGSYFGVSDGKGLLVTSVEKDSAGAKAGLKAGDVIVEIDGKKLSRTYDLIHALGQKDEGDVSLKVVRDKKERTIKVTPEKSKNGENMFFNEFYLRNDKNDEN